MSAPKTTTFHVGMTCDGCANAVKRILGKMEGMFSSMLRAACVVWFLLSVPLYRLALFSFSASAPQYKAFRLQDNESDGHRHQRPRKEGGRPNGGPRPGDGAAHRAGKMGGSRREGGENAGVTRRARRTDGGEKGRKAKRFVQVVREDRREGGKEEGLKWVNRPRRVPSTVTVTVTVTGPFPGLHVTGNKKKTEKYHSHF
ncbi:Heavy metal-associated domain, HMA [Nannochloropsis gaditana]|uniref:Heavy metal-associated domain, HMA n=1 Tax=Nannochloropsis gaditana TaxID=72520 RepID=W7T9M6_9STRA|nr:Heavy metal-associated domain, HMA [Nannochloropsis gaditana]